MAAGKVSSRAKALKKKVIKKAVKKATKKAVKKAVSKKALSSVKVKSPIRQRANFRLNEYIVYPAHGVGQIVEIRERVIEDKALEFFVIHFKQERMVLHVPVNKVSKHGLGGMRKLADKKVVSSAFAVLRRPAKAKRAMWSRRAQEYDAKINSGDLVLLCEVVRDLYRADHQPEQSYSERQLYEGAFARLMYEIAAVKKLSDEAATEMLVEVLNHPNRFASRKVVKDE